MYGEIVADIAARVNSDDLEYSENNIVVCIIPFNFSTLSPPHKKGIHQIIMENVGCNLFLARMLESNGLRILFVVNDPEYTCYARFFMETNECGLIGAASPTQIGIEEK